MSGVIVFLSWIGLMLLGYFIVDVIIGIVYNITNKRFCRNVPVVRGRYQPIEKDGLTTFVVDENFKILALTDTHIGGGILSSNEDRLALRKVRNLIIESRPDLVIITGDIVYTTRIQTLNNNNIKAVKRISNMLDAMQVYWAPVLGNHDAEDAKYTRAEFGDYLESDNCKYCLFKRGSRDVDGEGNYVINVENECGGVIKSLYLMDSNEYYKSEEYLIKSLTKYDNVHANQIEWYKQQIDQMAKRNHSQNLDAASSLLFVHIPLGEYKRHERGEELSGKKRERICVGYNHGLFEAILAKGNTTAVFCGHDHTNDFIIEHCGIKLCYIGSIDYLAYVWTKFYNPARGGRVIEITDNHTHTYRIDSRLNYHTHVVID